MTAMRDFFEDVFAPRPVDPMEAARQAMRPPLRRRFYRDVSVAADLDGHAIQLDGRRVRTPARRLLAAPTAGLAECIAAEWAAVGETIDPARMPLTRLANSIIDGVADAREAVFEDVLNYLGSDLVFYRAGQPQGLVAAQSRAWDPILAWAREALGAQFVLAEGVIFVAQPARALAAAKAAIPGDPWRLGAVHAATTLTGSALLALALLRGRLSAEEAWAAANVDEDWNMDQWGRDALALERRAFRWAEMQAAAAVLAAMPEAAAS